MEDNDRKNYIETLLKLYSEQVAHTRHHETMRAQSTNYIIAGSVALIGVLAADKVFNYELGSIGRWALTFLIIILNLWGVALSRKHAERKERHSSVANEYRMQVSKEFKNPDFPAPDSLRMKGHEKHDMLYPKIQKWSIHIIWESLHYIFIGGAVLLAIFGNFQRGPINQHQIGTSGAHINTRHTTIGQGKS